MILKVENVSKNFKGLKAVDNISFEINENEILAIIGPNGAGKTTLFNLISGLIIPNTGSKISFLGEDITFKPSYEIARKGISRTFQIIGLFPKLSVYENILISAQMKNESSFFSTMLSGQNFIKNEKNIAKYTNYILELLQINNYKNYIVGELPYGIQKLVELARAVASKPRLLLLDEPASGMSFDESLHLTKHILDLIEKFKISILLVEHDMIFVRGLADRIIVMNYGHQIAEGKFSEIENNELVIEAYLGRKKVNVKN